MHCIKLYKSVETWYTNDNIKVFVFIVQLLISLHKQFSFKQDTYQWSVVINLSQNYKHRQPIHLKQTNFISKLDIKKILLETN